jgi:hypothetical protein
MSLTSYKSTKHLIREHLGVIGYYILSKREAYNYISAYFVILFNFTTGVRVRIMKSVVSSYILPSRAS